MNGIRKLFIGLGVIFFIVTWALVNALLATKDQPAHDIIQGNAWICVLLALLFFIASTYPGLDE